MRPYQPRQIVCEVCGRSCNAARDASRHLPPVPAQGAERSLHPLQPDDSSSRPPNGAMPSLRTCRISTGRGMRALLSNQGYLQSRGPTLQAVP